MKWLRRELAVLRWIWSCPEYTGKPGSTLPFWYRRLYLLKMREMSGRYPDHVLASVFGHHLWLAFMAKEKRRRMAVWKTR